MVAVRDLKLFMQTRMCLPRSRGRQTVEKLKRTSTIKDIFQNYYGIAVRSNAGNLEGMKKSVHTALLHVALLTSRLKNLKNRLWD